MNKEYKYLFEKELRSIVESSTIVLPKDLNELEVRFGENRMNRFNSDIGIENFTKIYEKFKNKGKNQLIFDWLFRNEITRTLPKKFERLVRRQTLVSTLNIFDDIVFDDYDFRNMKIILDTYQKKELESKRRVKIKDYSDLTPLEQKNDDDNQYKRRICLTRGSIIFLSKSKVITHTTDNLRFTHAIEHIFDFKDHHKNDLYKLLQKNIPYSDIRIKHRYTTYIDKIWRLDLTTVKVGELKWMRGLGKVNDKEYQVEIEFDLDKYLSLNKKPSVQSMMESLEKLINSISENMIQSSVDVQPMNPHTLERKDLRLLSSIPYSVTDKADGERMFLHINEKYAYLRNPKTGKLELKIQMDGNHKDNIGSIIDGEYLTKTNNFYAFDMLFDGSKDMRGENLRERLEGLKKYRDVKFKNLKFFEKKFYFEDIFKKSKELWDNKNQFSYNLDGLIYTPIDKPYVTKPDNKYPVFKWKDDHTIDVRVEHTRDFTYFHFNADAGYGRMTNRTGKIWEDSSHYRTKSNQMAIVREIRNNFTNYNFEIKHARFSMNDNKAKDYINNGMMIKRTVRNGHKNYLGVPGILSRFENETITSKYDIIEISFDKEKRVWVPIRKRTYDKEAPNKYRTVEGTLRAILENVTIDEVSSLFFSPNLDVGLQYDLTKDTTKTRGAWRNFHNYAKSILISKSACSIKNKRKFLLDLGTGKGGDVSKWIESGYTDILGIEPSEESAIEFFERLLKRGFKKTSNGFRMKKGKKGKIYDPPINIQYVIGDASKNLKTGEAGINDVENKKLFKFFSNKNFDGFDTISIMFVIHYLFMNDKTLKKDENKFIGLMKNIDENLKPDGSFIGTFMDGKRINKIVKVNKGMHNFMHENERFYGIELDGDVDDSKVRKWKSYWDMPLRIMNVWNEVWGDDTIPEPEIYSNTLDILFKKYNLKSLLEDNCFESLYEFGYLNSDIIKSYGKKLTGKQRELSDGHKELSFLNSIFYYKRTDSKSNKVKTLLHVCNSHNFKKQINDFNKLFIRLSIEIPKDAKDTYKVLYKYINSKTSKEDVEEISKVIGVSNNKKKLKDYLKLMK